MGGGGGWGEIFKLFIYIISKRKKKVQFFLMESGLEKNNELICMFFGKNLLGKCLVHTCLFMHAYSYQFIDIQYL